MPLKLKSKEKNINCNDFNSIQFQVTINFRLRLRKVENLLRSSLAVKSETHHLCHHLPKANAIYPSLIIDIFPTTFFCLIPPNRACFFSASSTSSGRIFGEYFISLSINYFSDNYCQMTRRAQRSMERKRGKRRQEIYKHFHRKFQFFNQKRRKTRRISHPMPFDIIYHFVNASKNKSSLLPRIYGGLSRKSR